MSLNNPIIIHDDNSCVENYNNTQTTNISLSCNWFDQTQTVEMEFDENEKEDEETFKREVLLNNYKKKLVEIMRKTERDIEINNKRNVPIYVLHFPLPQSKQYIKGDKFAFMKFSNKNKENVWSTNIVETINELNFITFWHQNRKLFYFINKYPEFGWLSFDAKELLPDNDELKKILRELNCYPIINIVKLNKDKKLEVFADMKETVNFLNERNETQKDVIKVNNCLNEWKDRLEKNTSFNGKHWIYIFGFPGRTFENKWNISDYNVNKNKGEIFYNNCVQKLLPKKSDEELLEKYGIVYRFQ
jgi:hypothetical protein